MVNADDTLPTLKRTTLWKILKKLGFKWMKRSRNSALMERQDIVLWRRRYLTSIRKFRAEGRKVYYLDETWVNAGHTKQNIWEDTTVLTARQAFVEGVSTGLKNPAGKGRRLIILHIGSEDGFVENGLLFFESKKTGDYHEDMNSEVFTEWMRNVLPFLEANSVIVMDNAPYHSVRTEKLPTSAWKKQELIEWLLAKGIDADNTLLKLELLELAKKYNADNPITYVIDEMVADSGRTILRLPPYHCNLNPIELIWAQVKHHVAANNKTFKLSEVKTLLIEGLNIVSSDAWRSCIKHVIEEEKKMYQLDNIIEDMVEEFIIRANTSSSSELSLESDSE